MKKTITTIIFLVLVNFIFSQNNDFIKYNKIINQAELAIVDSLYSEALIHYEKAFKFLEIPIGKDLHNAALCSMYLGKFDNVFKYFNLLVEKGVEKEYFENETFTPLQKDYRYQKFLESFQENHNNAINRKNIKLLKEINQMKANDQKLANLKNFDPTKHSEFIDTVVSNVVKLEKIIGEFGFPDENILGIKKPYYTVPIGIMILHFHQIESMYSFLKDTSNYNNPQFDSRRHIIDIDFSKFKIHELTKNAILNGKFSPNLFAHYQDASEIVYGSMAMIQVDRHLGNIRYTGKREQQINTNRAAIGLESLKDYYKKVEFYQRNKGYTLIRENETIEEYKNRTKLALNDTKEKFEFGLAGQFVSYFFTIKEEGDDFFESQMNKYK